MAELFDKAILIEERVADAISLLVANEPDGEPYYLAFSGGKDSCVIKQLAIMAGVKFEAFYNNTTIDPPELVRFIKQCHPDVRWNMPKMNMLQMVATAPKVPPTRSGRWCCSVYKEGGGNERVKIIGVRAAESVRRRMWSEITEDAYGSTVICPIVRWSGDDIWKFIREHEVPYCELYDQGFDRLGCVGCPLATQAKQQAEFDRWPKYEQAWKRAIIRNWEKWKDVPNTRTGLPRYHAKFKSGEDFYEWWRTAKAPDYIRGDCQSDLLWTNEDVTDIG